MFLVENQSFSIVQYKPGIESIFFDLLRISMGETAIKKRTAEYWNWKHLRNPFGVSRGFYAADDVSKTVIALRILMSWSFKTQDGVAISAVRAVDTCTHPGYRRKGLFSVLTKQAIEELRKDKIPFIFNTPNQNSLPGYLKLGWKIAAKFSIYCRIISPIKFILKSIFFNKNASTPKLNEIDFFKVKIDSWEEFENRFGSQIEELINKWEQNRKGCGFRTLRSLSYFKWRYAEHPYVGYKVYSMPDEFGLAGFIVLRPNYRRGQREILLTELYLREPSSLLAKKLFKGLKNNLKAEYLVAHFADATLEKRMLLRAGFFCFPLRKFIFTVKSLFEISPNISLRKNWDLSLGDLEVF